MTAPDTRVISHELVMAALAAINRQIEQRQRDDAESEPLTIDLGQL